jgi:hypothetical protein
MLLHTSDDTDSEVQLLASKAKILPATEHIDGTLEVEA